MLLRGEGMLAKGELPVQNETEVADCCSGTVDIVGQIQLERWRLSGLGEPRPYKFIRSVLKLRQKRVLLDGNGCGR